MIMNLSKIIQLISGYITNQVRILMNIVQYRQILKMTSF